MYTYRASHGALTEQILRLDEYRLQIFENWKGWSAELRGDRLRRHCGHELSLFLETWKSEQRWNIYKMFWNEYKDDFISVGSLMVRVCTLNDAMTRIFVHTHDDDRIDAMLSLVIRLVRFVDVKRFSNIQERYTRQRHLQWISARRLRTINFSFLL